MQMTMSREVTLIVKVTNACNMRCRYCFIEPSVFHKTMSSETAERVVRAFLDSDHFESVHFVWHGGEPLLRGRAFFERVFEAERCRPTRVGYTNAIQTNATLLDEAMMAFLLENEVYIGLSLDGPRALNDPARQIPMRKMLPLSAHDTTVDAAARLRARGQAPGAIVVVNATNVGCPQEVYREFKRRAIDLKLNPLTRSGLAVTEGADLGISAEQYGRFLVAIFDAWFDDPEPTISIEPIRQHIARVLGLAGVIHACHFTRSCHRSFLGIAPDGDLYPCGMFQGEPAFRYGNIHELRPEEVAETALFGRISERERRVLEGCSACAFLDLCYSGCMFHSLKNSAAFEEKDYYCAGYRMYFEHMLRRVHADLTLASSRCARPADN